jgi:hypothetical protein
MSKQFRITHALAVSAMALTFSVSAQAGASRTFVSTTGSDSNTSVNCSPSTPCRTFAAAISVTNSGGEVVVLTSGGYGPATISQPVIITAIGIDASISVTTSGGAGLTVNTPGNVTLIGLNLHGEGTGLDGILVQQVGFLRLYNMLIENITNNGVDFGGGGGKLAIYGSKINDNGNAGLFVANTSDSEAAYVQGSSFDHNLYGVNVFFGSATVTDSSAEYSGSIGFNVDTGILVLFNDAAIFNHTGLASNAASELYFANCLISNNATAYSAQSGGVMAGTNPGTSFIAPGQTTSGSLSTIALQ